MLPLLVGILQDALEFIETSVTGWNCVQDLDIKFKMIRYAHVTPRRRCENGKPIPVTDPDWIKLTQQLADASKAA